LYLEDLNLNQIKIINIKEPVDDNEAATKGYTDRKLANIVLVNYLKRDGSSSMTGDLNKNDNKKKRISDSK